MSYRRLAFAPWLLLSACSAGAPPSPRALHAPSAADPATAPVAPPPPRQDGRLPRLASVVGADLAVRIDPAASALEGEVRYRLVFSAPARHLVLHARGVQVQGGAVRSAAGDSPVSAASRPAHGSSPGADEELVVSWGELAGPGEAELALSFRAPLGGEGAGAYVAESAGLRYVLTQFQPNDARRAFPCFDEPSFKHPWRITIEHPAGLRAFANQPDVEASQARAGWVRTRFAETPPLPSYLVAFAVGPWDVLEGPREPVPVRVIAPRGRAPLGEQAVDVASRQLAVLADWFGRPYPYAKLDLVAAPELAAGAMENAGLVTFREELLLQEPGGTTTGRRRALHEVMAHELAHQWFGNLVTPAWWDDLWLNEAFASWMEGQVLARDPRFAKGLAADNALSLHRALALDGLGSARRVRQPVTSTAEALEAFDGITYAKGAAVLDMVERWLGPTAFRRGLREYLARHAWGNATASDLFAALSAAAAGAPVEAVVTSFVDRKGAPALEARPACDGAPRVALTQAAWRARGGGEGGDALWSVPVEAVGPAGVRGSLLLVASEGSVPLERCVDWVWPNAEERGYYRVVLRPESARRLLAARAELSPPVRVGLLGSAWASVEAGTLPGAEFVALLEALAGDPERAVAEQWATGVRRVAALVPESAEGALAAWLARVTAPALTRLGQRPRPGETDEDALHRVALLALLGDLAPQALPGAVAVAEAWRTGPSRVAPDLARVMLPVSARRGGPAEVRKWLDVARHAGTPEQRVLALVALGGLERREDLGSVLDALDEGALRAHELPYVLRGWFARPRSTRAFLALFEERADAWLGRLPPFVAASVADVLARVCDRRELAEHLPRFERLAAVEGAARALAQAREAADRCATLREAEGAALEAALGPRARSAGRRP